MTHCRAPFPVEVDLPERYTPPGRHRATVMLLLTAIFSMDHGRNDNGSKEPFMTTSAVSQDEQAADTRPTTATALCARAGLAYQAEFGWDAFDKHTGHKVCVLGGQRYVVLLKLGGVLAVYRVDGAEITRLDEWPELLDKAGDEEVWA